MTNYVEMGSEIAKRVTNLKKSTPKFAETFWQLIAKGSEEGKLSKKTKELIAIAVAVSSLCDDCIVSHMKIFIAGGGTREELVEMLDVVIYMGGGPAMMYASHALEAFDQFNK